MVGKIGDMETDDFPVGYDLNTSPSKYKHHITVDNTQYWIKTNKENHGVMVEGKEPSKNAISLSFNNARFETKNYGELILTSKPFTVIYKLK